jgi:acyl-CoA synthetase (NDP forming)
MTELGRLLRPGSVAVIGGGTWGANVVAQCRKIGFAGPLWAVHPTKENVGGVRAYPDVAGLPGAPDAAFIGVNRDATPGVVAALAARGAGGAVCFAAGFGEAQAETGDGAMRQADLLAAAREMPVLGPNCYGFINYLDGAALWPDQHGGVRVARGVAIVTQSSNIAINLTMQRRGLPVAYVVTVGNQARVGLAEVASALMADERVTALGLHIEGIGDLAAFEAMAAEARRLRKPVVALKVGRSGLAQAATVSHTASLAGSDAGARALFERLGIGEVRSLSGFLEALKLLHVAGPLTSNRIASMSCSGGEASLMADSAEGSGLVFPPLGEGQRRALRAALGPKVALANPLDYHTYIWGDVSAMAATFSGMMTPELAMGCVVLDFPRADRCDPAAWEPVLEAVAQAKAASGRPMAVLSTLGENMPEAMAGRLAGAGIVPFSGLGEAIEAMAAAASIGRRRAEEGALVLPGPASATRVLAEAQAKAELAGFGLAVPRAERAASAEQAAAAAERIGFPVVLKGEGIAHKTEAGAVRLNLFSAGVVAEEARAMPAESFLIEEMVTGTVAELLVGVVCDQAHGYVLTLAAGGTLTELFADRASLLVPSGRETVRTALEGLRVWPLLAGYRGAAAADVEAVLDAVKAVQAYVAAVQPGEIEINPLLCGPFGAVAADALIRKGETDD